MIFFTTTDIVATGTIEFQVLIFAQMAGEHKKFGLSREDIQKIAGKAGREIAERKRKVKELALCIQHKKLVDVKGYGDMNGKLKGEVLWASVVHAIDKSLIFVQWENSPVEDNQEGYKRYIIDSWRDDRVHHFVLNENILYTNKEEDKINVLKEIYRAYRDLDKPALQI